MDALQLQEQKEEQAAPQRNEQPNKRGISGSTLKLIAICTMLIDHIGAGILGRYLVVYDYAGAALSGDLNLVVNWMQEHSTLFLVYSAMRMIGRIAFPIFCFLLVEGFQRTSNAKKYAMRLGAFALLSEIPFDLAFSGKLFAFSYQNVFLTLFLGMLCMMAFDWIDKKENFNNVVKVLLSAASFVLFAGIAAALKTDYGAIGIACIMALYIFRGKKVWQIAAGCVAFLWEVTAPLAFIPIGFYNGKRGLRLKYLFYAFYPVHLFLIYLVCVFLGIAGISAV